MNIVAPMIQPSIELLIQQAVTKAVENEIEAEIKEISKRVELRVRGEVGRIAATVLKRFSFEQYGEQLKIIVDFKNTQP